MAKTIKKFFVILLLMSVFASSADAQLKIKWRRVHMDGSRTGCTAPSADNVPEALGTFEADTYVAPNGKEFKGGATAAVAALLLEVQPQVAYLKEVVGYSPKEMIAEEPESDLSNWTVDVLMQAVEKSSGKKVDVGITNFGGIRVDMPKGDVLLDDIMSMFPFKNNICYVRLKGSELRKIYESMAQNRVQVVGGVEMVIKDKSLQSIKVGGEPLDDNKSYGLATISFLLDGGDGLNLARNAEELIICDELVIDAMLPYVRSLTAAGKEITYQTDGRVKIL